MLGRLNVIRQPQNCRRRIHWEHRNLPPKHSPSACHLIGNGSDMTGLMVWKQWYWSYHLSVVSQGAYREGYLKFYRLAPQLFAKEWVNLVSPLGWKAMKKWSGISIVNIAWYICPSLIILNMMITNRYIILAISFDTLRVFCESFISNSFDVW